MPSNTAKNIIELRRLLAEKFPSTRMKAGRPETLVQRWPTGLPQLDLQLEGGLGKSCITEIISSGVRSGSSLLISELVRRSSANGEWIALVDGADSFDPVTLETEELSRLLWVRCSQPREAIKAADLLLHDGTIPIVVIDLVGCAARLLRKIPSNTWHRLARTIENTATVCVTFTPEIMISTAERRLQLQPRFTLESIDAERRVLLEQIVARPPADELNIAPERKARTA